MKSRKRGEKKEIKDDQNIEQENRERRHKWKGNYILHIIICYNYINKLHI